MILLHSVGKYAINFLKYEHPESNKQKLHSMRWLVANVRQIQANIEENIF